MTFEHPSITEPEESELIRTLLADWYFRNWLTNVKDLRAENALILLEVPLQDYERNRHGDIDILIIPDGQAHLSTAIQVKRLPLILDGSDAVGVAAGRMKKLFNKGVEQANLTADLGFHQVYLWAFVVIDSRQQNDGQDTFDGASPVVRSRIEQVVTRQFVDPRVGLMEWEYVQPMDKAPLTIGSHGGTLHGLAGQVEQPPPLTAWLQTLKASDDIHVAPYWGRRSDENAN